MRTEWRPLTEAEAANWPMARLGGALLGMTVVAGLMTVLFMLFILFVGYALFSLTLFGVAPSLLEGIGDGMSDAQLVGLIYIVPTVTFIIWSTVFFAMTLARAPATPTVAVWTYAVQFAIGIIAPVVGQAFIYASHGGGAAALVMTIASSLPMWALALLVALGFGGYLLGGVRPNAYYRRRIAAPPGAGPSHPA